MKELSKKKIRNVLLLQHRSLALSRGKIKHLEQENQQLKEKIKSLKKKMRSKSFIYRIWKKICQIFRGKPS